MKCTYPKDDPGKCFHILGVDIMLDSHGTPWILEINANPSLNIEATSETKRTGEFTVSPIDLHVKSM
jgi:D-alanine-D-alanine ligase-like ATP-grasp enzyme